MRLSERDVLLWLCTTPGIGSVTVQKLIRFFQDFEAIWQASEADMVKLAGVPKNMSRQLMQSRSLFDPINQRSEFEPYGIRFVTWICSEYPETLREIYDPPYGLFVAGQIPSTGTAALSVVGSRTPTGYGRVAAKKLVTECAAKGLTIVSGLARGIDTVAHEAALLAGGQTIAVLGSGLQSVYPPENRRLAEQIADGRGAVISEWPPLTKGKPSHFPVRNRIIAALSQATLVVEAGQKSGSLITVDQALEQGRDVYAVPGPITSPQSDGTNRLIQQGAKLVHTAMDVLEDYATTAESASESWKSRSSDASPSTSIPSSTSTSKAGMHPNESQHKEAERLLEALGGMEAHADQLLERTGLDAGTLHMWLLRLQVTGQVAALPGGKYVRI